MYNVKYLLNFNKKNIHFLTKNKVNNKRVIKK